MAGPQDYLTVQGPQGASYQLPKFDLGSQIAQIPTSYQEGQQYGVKRGLQTMFPDGNYPTTVDPQTGQQTIDIGAIAKKAMAIGGPEAAAPYLNMLFDQQNSRDFANIGRPGSGQPQGQPNPPPQAPTPLAPNSATGRAGITGEHLSTGDGSIFPYTPGTSPPKIVGDGAAPQGGAGLQGQPAPFAGNRDQQGAPPQPQISFTDRIPPGGGMSNRPTVAEDGTGGQPTAPTSSRETANNGRASVDADPRWAEVNRLKDIATQYNAVAARMTARPQLAAQAKDAADRAGKEAQTRAEAIYKDYELTPGQKDVAAGVPQTTASMTEAGKGYETARVGLQKQAIAAGQEIPKLDLAARMVNDSQFYSGPWSGFVNQYKQVIASLGGDPTKAVSNEVFQKNINDMLLNQIRSLGGQGLGQVRVAEIRIMEKAVASMGITPASNRALIEIAKRTYADSAAVNNLAQQYAATHGGRLDQGWDRIQTQYYQTHPLFQPHELEHPATIAPPRMTRADAESRLPPGTPYVGPNGERDPRGMPFMVPRQ